MDTQKDTGDSSNKSNTVKTNKKSKINGLTITVLVFVAIALIGLIILFIAVRYDEATQGADQNIRLASQGGFECEYAEAQKLYPYAEGVIKVTSSRVSYLTVSGSEIYGVAVNYQNPNCVINGDIAAVLDVDGYGFSVYSTDGQIYAVSTGEGEQVKSATIADNGTIAVITSLTDGYGQVLIYDAAGNKISSWNSYESGYPVSCAFNSDVSLLSVCAVNTTGTTFVPTVKMISLTTVDGVTAAEDYAVYSVADSDFISKVLFCGTEFYAFSEDSIYKLNEENGLAGSGLDVGVIEQVFSVNGNLFVIYSQGVGQLDNIAVIDSSGSKIYDSQLGTTVNSFSVSGSNCIISVDDRIFVIDSNGNIKSDIQVDEDVIRVGFLSSDRVVVVSTGGVHIINI